MNSSDYVRPLARVLAQELTPDEIGQVHGGDLPGPTGSTDTYCDVATVDGEGNLTHSREIDDFRGNP